MPLLDIATAQPALQNNLGPLGTQTRAKVFPCQFIFGDEKRLCCASKPFQFFRKANFNLGHLETRRRIFLISAVATLEPKTLVRKDGQENPQPNMDSGLSTVQFKSSGEDSEELDEREKLRRMRISKANKGNTPWNKGRKHSAETLQRIKERTRLAMQNPKVKMKLVNLGHAQSAETRKKIGVGVRMGWEKRREKLMVQESCHFEWQNLIAEASKRGLVGEAELQWDSYKILDAQLKQEWFESVEERKKMPRLKGSKRAPKSAEQRRKIAEAIAAKWADPEYRERVCAGLTRFHGTPAGAGRRPGRKPSGDTQPRIQKPTKKKDSDASSNPISEHRSRIERLRLKRGSTPVYKDPSASSKLQMIKNIRAQRAAAESKKSEAVERARLLIAEAEKAAKALEIAATKSPIAHASLMETRKLIAEAIQSIESIEAGHISSNSESSGNSSVFLAEVASQVENVAETKDGVLNQTESTKINGTQTQAPSKDKNLNLSNFRIQDILNGEELLPRNTNGYSSMSTLNLESLIRQSSDSADQLNQPQANGNLKSEKHCQPNGVDVRSKEEDTPRPEGVTKRWVRGRLVEVTEET